MKANDVIQARKRWSVDCAQSLDWARSLPSESIQTIITSPPYFHLRDYKVDGQIGLEDTPHTYIAKIVEIFNELRRALRSDGICWINIGDTYARNPRSGRQKKEHSGLHSYIEGHNETRVSSMYYGGDCKIKDMIGIPWMLAFMLRASGWYLRQELIWSKTNSMPESIVDRCSKSHEHVFMLSKSPRYYFDFIAIRQKSMKRNAGSSFHNGKTGKHQLGRASTTERIEDGMANKRSVWSISVGGTKANHFAAFPMKLVIPMIRASTSEHGCCSKCGKAAVRLFKRVRVPTRPGLRSKITSKPGFSNWGAGGDPRESVDLSAAKMDKRVTGNRDPQRHVTVYETTGWKTCECNAPFRGSVIADPFCGTGTVGHVALDHGQDFIGCDLSPEYCEIADSRLSNVTPQVIVRPE